MKRGTVEHPKTIALAQRLGIEQWGAVGILETLWHWTARYAIQGNVGKWSDAVIAAGIGWREASPESLISALVQTGWLDESSEHRLVIHDLADHADNTWRQNLVDAGIGCFCNGIPARGSVGRPRKSRETPEKLQNNSRKYPQPEPEPSGVSPEVSSPDVLPGVFEKPLARSGGGAGEPAQRARARRSPPTSLWPDDLKLTDERRAVAAACGLDPAWEWNKFRDYAQANAARYANWDAAWRNWCRRATDYARRQHGAS